MPEGNPLVAARQDSTTAYSGIGIAESAMDVYHGVENKSWVEGGLGAAGAGLETLSLVLDPVGTLLSYGVAWLMEHVKPLSDALDWLAGDGDQIAAYAQTWKNVGAQTTAVAADFGTEVTNGTAGWQGEAAEAYRGWAKNQQARITAAGTGASTVGTVVEVVGMLVAAVREIVRDLVAECVATLIARIPQWLAEIGGTLGIATLHVVSAASALIAKWVNRIKDFILKLTRSLEKLRPIMDELGQIWQAIRDGLRKAPDSAPHSASPVSTVKSPGPDVPSTSPDATSPTGSSTPHDTTTDTPGGKPSPDTSSTSPSGTSSPSGTTTTPSGSTSPSGTPDGPGSTTGQTTPSGTDRPRGGWSGAGYVDEANSTPRARAEYERIRNTPDDVPRIAENTGIDPNVIDRAKRNLFIEEHDVQVGPGQTDHGYFTPDEDIADLWRKADEGTLTPDELNQFRGLVAHEYVEHRLMEAGMPYKSDHPDAWDSDGTALFNREHFGAHEVAPNAWSDRSLRHWRALGLEPPSSPILDDLSNLDEVVEAAKRGLNL